MPNLTSGSYNVASGTYALYFDNTGSYNVASGRNALYYNTGGNNNVASGVNALFSNTTGTGNVANGFQALYGNTTGGANVASGNLALDANTNGGANVANGASALGGNTSGSRNNAIGNNALLSNTTGNQNVANGQGALIANTTGFNNAAFGFRAGANLTSGSNNVYLANAGVAAESGQIHIGTNGTHTGAFLAGTSGVSIPGPTQAVVVNANGQLGTATASSAALKRDVRPLAGAASRRVLALRPVSYRYKRRHAGGYDRLQYGLIAEQVARQLPALVQRGPSGKPSGVYYEQLSALLLSELKRQHRELRRQGRELRRLRAQVLGRR
jgi:endosialidase-like protein